MPQNLKRYQESKQSHFTTFSCNCRQPRFTTPELCDLFLSSLEQTRKAYAMLVYAYVVMPEHVHLLLSEPEQAQLSTAIQALKVSVSKLVPTLAPKAGARVGHPQISGALWQKRYYDFNIRNYRQFVEKLRYIHRNPVKRGLCERPEDWEWSSFRHYATGGKGRVEIESEWLARKRERAEGKFCPAVKLPHSSPVLA